MKLRTPTLSCTLCITCVRVYNPINVITLTGQVVTVDRAREGSHSFNMEYNFINTNNTFNVYVDIKNVTPL